MTPDFCFWVPPQFSVARAMVKTDHARVAAVVPGTHTWRKQQATRACANAMIPLAAGVVMVVMVAGVG